jgi:hypothetical protein
LEKINRCIGIVTSSASLLIFLPSQVGKMKKRNLRIYFTSDVSQSFKGEK